MNPAFVAVLLGSLAIPQSSPETPRPGAVIKGHITLTTSARVTEVAIAKAPEELVKPQQRKKTSGKPNFVFLQYRGKMPPDDSGRFEFGGLEPGFYFLELTVMRGVGTAPERPRGDDGKEIVLEIKTAADVVSLDVVVGDSGSRRVRPSGGERGSKVR